MADDPFRLRVQQALTTALAEISIAGGYQFDLGAYEDATGRTRERVFRGRSDFSTEHDPETMLAINEDPGEAELVAVPPVEAKGAEADYRLLVQGFTKDDPVHPTDPAQRLLADVKKRLGAEKRRRHDDQPDFLGMGPGRGGRNQITGMRIGRGVVRPADGIISDTAHFWLVLVLRLYESEVDPYA